MSTDSADDDRSFPLFGIALIGTTTLCFEILLTRVFSVTMWYHFAFVAISLALLGIAASGVLVTVLPRTFSAERALEIMAWASVAFGVTVPLGFVADLHIPFVPFDAPEVIERPLWPYLLFFAKFVALSTPFFFSGLCIALAFTHAPGRVDRTYFADLAGGAIGCVAAVCLLLVLSAPSAVILTATFAFVAAGLFFRQGARRRPAALSFGAAVLMVVLAVVNEGSGAIAVAKVKSYDPKKAQVEEKEKAYERWHPVSRVVVHTKRVSSSSKGWFYSKKSAVKLPKLMEVTNDAGARTYLWPAMNQEKAEGIFRDDVSDMVYSLTENPSVLVVGVGGGKDVLSALAMDASTVTAVELNPLMIRVVQDEFGDFTGRPYDDPRVEVVIDEARNYVASHDRRFDVIKISVTDTWAASAGGAYALTENYLYTREAMDDFLDHLEPGGYLSITRWYPQETYRLVALANQSLRARGITKPEKHVVMARNRTTMTLVVKNEPFTEDEQATFAARTREAGLGVVWAGDEKVTRPKDDRDKAHRKIAKAKTKDFDALGKKLELSLTVPTDDRPFFFNIVSLAAADDAHYGARGGFMREHGRALNLLLGLLRVSLVLAALFVLAPAAVANRGLLGTTPVRIRLIANAYFLLLGLGFMLIEVPLLQQFILFLGHPTYAVTVVLASLLVTSGLGSLFAARVGLDRPDRRIALFTVLVVLVVASGTLLPHLLRAMIGLPIAGRIVIAVLAIAPLGLLLGMPFPAGLMRLHGTSKALVPWAWAVNGAASVAAPVLAMVIAIAFGFSTALILGAACYALAGVALAQLGDARTATARPASEV